MRKLYFVILFAILIGTTACNVFSKGNRVTTEREVKEFTGINSCCGIDVIITQSDQESVRVEADESVQSSIETTVQDHILTIYKDSKRHFIKNVKVYVSVKELNKIEVSSGSDISCTNQIISDMIQIDANSGADVHLNVKTKYATISTSSGSDVVVSGTANVLNASANSAGDINAQGLATETCKVEASSGSDIIVNAKEEIIADANSGADIRIFGNPIEKKITQSSGGDVALEK